MIQVTIYNERRELLGPRRRAEALRGSGLSTRPLYFQPHLRIHAPADEGGSMARAPNYNHERKERERIKAAKKAEKLAAKAAAKERAVSADRSEAEGKD
ncbi:hypothetical protein [Chelativorans sp. AA-79]|uniref:hypothetical protein n=1 Tax=Chelativorans sp. AA-79 TaxID=3028735 RepID=UPI0023F8B934|nr:hypothetical protein [Chelativorans sp. AA-79]WEX12052.1 hypothetical protein PVE73_09640 [Chelativorans sp. AA-79]